jgi:hypothetical protein
VLYVNIALYSPNGKRRKPLDEMLALKPRGRYSQGVALKASYLVSELPYRKISPVLSWLVATEISHSTIGRLMLNVGQSVDAEEEEARNRVFEQGEVPEAGKIPAKVLYGESDGVFISFRCSESSRKRQKYKLGSSTQAKKPSQKVETGLKTRWR